MSWLLFLDESGHDHKQMPYEVRIGVAIHARFLANFNAHVRELEREHFGCRLQDVRSEIKGSKLLQTERYNWARQGESVPADQRRRDALNFLNASLSGKVPRRHEFTAYGQACIAFVQTLVESLARFNVSVFASIIPPIPPALAGDGRLLRRDLRRLVRSFSDFVTSHDHTLTEVEEKGLLVIDRSEKTLDRQFAVALEQELEEPGFPHLETVISTPFFVDSDSMTGVQVADVCAYVLNWGLRRPGFRAPVRAELVPLAMRVDDLAWTRFTQTGEDKPRTLRQSSIFFTDDPYGPPDWTLFDDLEMKKEASPSGPP
jgi:Protein of unknown function (DUF3800)